MTNSAAEATGLRRAAWWPLPLVLLFGAWLWVAFAAGGYQPGGWVAGRWLLPAVLTGLFGLVAAAWLAYPRRPRQLSLVVLTVFGLYTVWVAASALWAASPARAGLEALRTGALLLVFALALVYLTDAGARRVFRYLLMASALVLLAVCLARLWIDPQTLFAGNRLSFPIGYPSGSAALFLIAFWPLVWLGAAPDERAPVRGIALGLATGLLGLALMTQSRAAIYSLALTLLVTFIVSPIRLRTLFYLIIPGLLMVYLFPRLERYWVEGPAAVGGGMGARTIVVAAITAAFMGMIVALTERWVPASRRMKAIFGTVVLLGCLAGVIYGALVFTENVGGPGAWLSRAWSQFTSEQAPAEDPAAGSRLVVVSSSGAMTVWKTAWRAFEEKPVMGAGADNLVFTYDRLRTDGDTAPRQAHSLGLQVLADSGAIGGGLLGLAVLLSLGGILWGRVTAAWRHARATWLHVPGHTPRSERGSRRGRARWGDEPPSYGWDMALLSALVYWIVQASLDELWQTTAVVVPALLLLAAALASVDGRVDAIWPRWERWLRVGRARARTGDPAPPPTEEPERQLAVASAAVALASTTPGVVSTPVRPVADAESSAGAADSAPADPGPPDPGPVDRGLAKVGATSADVAGVAATGSDASVTGAGSAGAQEPLLRRYQGPDQGDGFGLRRSDQYVSKWRRRRRRELRRRRSADRLQPAGPFSAAFRAGLLVVGLVVLLGAAVPYVSYWYEGSAQALAQRDPGAAVSQAVRASWLRPGDGGPFVTQGDIYSAAAVAAAGTQPADRSGAVCDDLALAVSSYEKASLREPAPADTHYRAAVAALNLLVAMSRSAPALDPIRAVDYRAARSSMPGLEDWEALETAGIPGQPGSAAGTLWPPTGAASGAPASAARYRAMDRAALADSALGFLEAARQRNPAASAVQAAATLAQDLKAAASAPQS